jgi:hypothetical protein
MPDDRLLRARSQFERRILEAEEFVRRSQGARHATASRRAMTTSQFEWAAEISLLKLVVASEHFFETTMALYTLGNRSPSGYRPRRRSLRVTGTVPNICAMFRGDQRFVGWIDPSDVIRRAERWFRHGDPFQATLSGASQILAYLKKMRNTIAHESETAQDTYVNATRQLYGALPRRVLPGAQLLAPPPRSIPYLVGGTLFEAALNSYRGVAARIVP